jgi:hypothetical protein
MQNENWIDSGGVRGTVPKFLYEIGLAIIQDGKGALKKSQLMND